VLATLTQIKRFFQWLAWQPGYKSRIQYADAEYFNAGLPYFNPHSFRNTLVQLGQEICKTPEQFKAWSQNLGHEKVLTTFLCYGEVACQRQGEIIRDLAKAQRPMPTGVDQIAEAVYKKLRSSGVDA